MAQDAFGNWVSGLTPAPAGTLPTGISGTLSGIGAPDNADGKNGNIYVNTTNGNVYRKYGGIWALLVAGVPGAQHVFSGVWADPNGHIIPEDLGTTALYVMDDPNLTKLWQWSVADQVWYELLG